MYKIQWYLLILTLLSIHSAWGQQGQIVHAGLTNEALTNRQTTFTVHLLTGLVDPEKKHEFEPLEVGRKVSLPFPIRFQIQNL